MSTTAIPTAADISARIRALPARDAATMRALRRELSKSLKAVPARDVVDLALDVLDGPGFVHRFIAYELVAHHRGALASLGADDLERFGRNLDSWWTVDTFACYLSGPAWRERQVPESLIRRWARSDDRWWRRTALVSTVPLNNRARGGSGDPERTLATCEMLVADRDDMVVKAMSWALRALAVRDPESVRAFMAHHGADLAPRVIREVRNKLETGLKSGGR